MWARILVVLFLAVAAYGILKYFENGQGQGQEQFGSYGPAGPIETPAMAMHIRKQIPYPEIQVSPSGPNAPNVAPEPEEPPRRAPQPQARDPYDDTLEQADAPPNLRHPERSFGPGIVPEKTRIAEQAGVAGPVTGSPQAFQQFSPEFVQNGGSFFANVSANEDDNPNYSAF